MSEDKKDSGRLIYFRKMISFLARKVVCIYEQIFEKAIL